MDRPLRLISNDAISPLDALARTLEALLVVASQPLTVDDLAEAAAEDVERIETALGLLRERYSEGRSGIVLDPKDLKHQLEKRAGACRGVGDQVLQTFGRGWGQIGLPRVHQPLQRVAVEPMLGDGRRHRCKQALRPALFRGCIPLASPG